MNQEKTYTIPESVLNGMLNVLASLPYNQVAPVMAAVNKVIAPQVGKAGKLPKPDPELSDIQG